MTITRKITIWYALFLLIISLAFSTLLIYLENSFSRAEAQSSLTKTVGEASEYIMESGSTFAISKYLKFYRDGIYLSVYDRDGNLIEGRRPIGLSGLPALKDHSFRYTKDDRGKVWYLYDNRFIVDQETVWVRGLIEDHRTLASYPSFIWVISGATFLLVLFALSGGYFIGRQAFAPVRSIIETVRDVSRDGNLDRRLDSPRTRDEIGMLTDEFNEMFRLLSEQQKKEKQFTSDASHELKTPLAVILAQCDYAKQDPDYRDQALEIIRQEASSLSTLVNTLLLLSRSDAGRLKIDENSLDLSEICEMIAQQQAFLMEEDQISLTTDLAPGLYVKGDEAMIMHIIVNLLSNAYRHGKNPGGHIHFSLSKNGRMARITVRDDGPGIDEDDLPHIWDRFYVSDPSRHSTGLGLAIVKSLTDLHHGTVRALNNPGGGCSFIVELPLVSQ